MVLFNYGAKEITAKIVYYGPGLCGKTTNLQYIYKKVPSKTKGKMISLATKSDRTLFFDFLPLDLGQIGGLRTRFQLYTVPGQVFYNSTRKLVLKGADSVVFVADSQRRMMPANIESFDNLKENLQEEGIDIESIPLVMQYNKRDLNDIVSIEELNKRLNSLNRPFLAACATSGDGVLETLKMISKLTLDVLSKKYRSRKSPSGHTLTVEQKSGSFVRIDKPITENIAKDKAEIESQSPEREEEEPEAREGISDSLPKTGLKDYHGDESVGDEPYSKNQSMIEEELDVEEEINSLRKAASISASNPRIIVEKEEKVQPVNEITIDGENIKKDVIKKVITAPITIPKGTRIKDITFDITLNIKVVTEDE